MEKLDVFIKLVVAVAGSGLTFLFGGWSSLLAVLIALVVLDFFAGMIAAFIEGKISSSVGWQKIGRKMIIFVVVAVAHLLDTVLASHTHFIRDATIFFYMVNEIVSIIENAGRSGLPIPPIIRRAIVLLNEKGKKKDAHK